MGLQHPYVHMEKQEKEETCITGIHCSTLNNFSFNSWTMHAPVWSGLSRLGGGSSFLPLVGLSLTSSSSICFRSFSLYSSSYRQLVHPFVAADFYRKRKLREEKSLSLYCWYCNESNLAANWWSIPLTKACNCTHIYTCINGLYSPVILSRDRRSKI